MSAEFLAELAWMKPSEDDFNGTGSPFAAKTDVNRKMHVYQDNGWKIPSDALVIGQTEDFSERGDGNDAIYDLAGPALEEECTENEHCPTGYSSLTSGGNLGCAHVIHSVGPKYDNRFVNASISALHCAYRSALMLAAQNNVKTLAINCIYIKDKRFPRLEAAHVALRTIRRVLEQPAAVCIEKVILCLPYEEDQQIYELLMRSYFPRTLSEENDQQEMLLADNGNAWGELVRAERQSSITAGPRPLAPGERRPSVPTAVPAVRRASTGGSSLPQHNLKKEEILLPWETPSEPCSPKEDLTTDGNGEDVERELRSSTGSTVAPPTKTAQPKTGDKAVHAVWSRAPSMTNASGDTDARRRSSLSGAMAVEPVDEQYIRQHAKMLERLDYEDLSDMAALQFITKEGKDHKGYTIVMIVASHVSMTVDLNRALLYVMKMMEGLRSIPYVLVYANSAATDDNTPGTSWLNDVFSLFSIRYKENLQQLYILHASVWFRMYLWGGLPFTVTKFWKDYVICNHCLDLDQYMQVRKMNLPEDVLLFDKYNFPVEHGRAFDYGRASVVKAHQAPVASPVKPVVTPTLIESDNESDMEE